MKTKEDFIKFIRGESERAAPSVSAAPASAVPGDYEGFDTPPAPSPPPGESTFASRLLEALGFGFPKLVQTASLVRSPSPVAKYLPERAAYWPKTADRPFHTILFEASYTHRDLQAIPAFRHDAIAHLDLAEDAVARLADDALAGFQRRDQSSTAETLLGSASETLCVVSLIDAREAEPARLVCFATRNKETDGLETFQITEAVRTWERQLADDYLGLLYERQFKKLQGPNWQEAFTTTEERRQAEHLLDVCARKNPDERDIQEAVIDLLDSIAKSFGLRKTPSARRRLQAFLLPAEHDIGIDAEEKESKFRGKNPFRGVTLRDEKSRLLGYIIYALNNTKDVARLSKYLEDNNKFHNVLVVYPHASEAKLELWQGSDKLIGKLRKDRGPKGAADVVNLLSRFFVVSKAKVRNPTDLAQELAYRARYLRRLALTELEEEGEHDPLRTLYAAFKEALVHDQKEEEFADAFAQTITYGLLTARWIGAEHLKTTGERFTRQTALKHLPATSPFLNDLFRSALSLRLDEQRGRLLWLVDDVADLLDRVNVTSVFGKGDADSDQFTDPVIHFYEPFLAAYDKSLKNKRGVFFTPRPVVSYIVRSVHEVLQKEFGLEDGLASTDTWGDVAKRIAGLLIPEGVKVTDPFVCILDPATGTGTFLYECIEVIERTMKDRWCRQMNKNWDDPIILALWRDYVPARLIPRLFGYELMMASYSVAHLKLSLKLQQTAYQLTSNDRIHIFLTNSLDEPSRAANAKAADLFLSLAREARVVNELKRGQRFTVVIGNPPYAGHSSNHGEWARALVDRYRRINGTELRLAQGKWLQNDYVKFLALAETTLAKSTVGVFGMITDNSYLDGDTFPGLRHSLLSSCSKLEVLNLHGSLTRREVPPGGGLDENVFEIQQGVAIIIGVVEPSGRKGFGKLQISDLWGDRTTKFKSLRETTSRTAGLTWRDAVKLDERCLFVPAAGTHTNVAEYDAFDSIEAIFSPNGRPAPGFLTTHDDFAIAFSKKEMADKVNTLISCKTENEAREHFKLCSQAQWNFRIAKTSLANSDWRQQARSCLYRPFDRRWTVYDAQVLVHRRERVNNHLLEPGNLALLTTRVTKGDDFRHVMVTDRITEVICLSSKTSANTFVFPLFLRDESARLPGMGGAAQRSGVDPRLVARYRATIGKDATPEAVFAYTYAILHSPSYRARYNEQLIRDFPRIPRPASPSLFRDLVSFGGQLIKTHLLQDPATTMRLDGVGDNIVAPGMPKYEPATQRLLLNKDRFLAGVTPAIWNFKIGSYDVCRKWLSERRGRKLSTEEVEQFLAMIVALQTTLVLQHDIDDLIAKHGGWPGAFVTSAETKP